MMFLGTIVLLALLFIVGLFFTLLNPQTKKLVVWFKSLFSDKSGEISQHVESIKPNGGQEKAAIKRSPTRDKAELKKVFATFDKNNDGFITKQELSESLRNIGIHMSEGEVAGMVEKVDSNGDGLIDLGEFCELFEVVGAAGGGGEVEEGVGGVREGGDRELMEAFDVFDVDRDGLISEHELRLVLSSLGMDEGKVLENCKEMIRQVDMDGDGRVNFDEFKMMMKAGGGLIQVS
ncbi:EF hand calcium-binding protein family [Actinidia rufa]|uniref:EF hand calcium-binding protein family n=1 Tax=Actinidia rufa TaxID=165716 RepID=A0A7J0FP60_9ERIC|nr:EF hand calcium-binding protein family [Actinidia rufa]